jgi:RNA-binding protein
MPAKLSSAQQRHLRSLAHALKPVVMVGAKGVTDSLVAELDLALAHHELIKIKIAAEDREARDQAVHDLLARVDASLVQRIGNIAVAYRASPDKPQIVLPR